MKEKTLTDREKLFCTYYSLKQNPKEAAILAGYRKFPEKTALRLLKKESIRNLIKSAEKKNTSSDAEVTAGLRRLCFGCVNDAVKLAFSDEVDVEILKDMDLFNISEIKVNRGKGIEIKFFDRLKALEKLSSIAKENEFAQDNDFYKAIEQGAAALINATGEYE